MGSSLVVMRQSPPECPSTGPKPRPNAHYLQTSTAQTGLSGRRGRWYRTDPVLCWHNVGMGEDDFHEKAKG